ncbi:MAG: hypothetical protein ACK5B6_13045 [Bacteroidia bacterium]
MNFATIVICIAILFTLLVSYKWISDGAEHLFWTSLIFYFDPGGFFSGFSEGSIFWRIKYYDVFFLLMMVSWILSDLWKNKISFEKDRFRFFTVGIALCSLYFLVVFGYIIPNVYGYDDFLLFLQKNRQYFYCFPVMIAVYQFTYFRLDAFIKPFLIISIFSLLAFFITLLSGIELLPVIKWSRFTDNDRIALWSYGLTNWLLPMGFIILFLKSSVEGFMRKVLLIGMALMLVTIILTLTRREFMRVFFMLISIPFIISLTGRGTLVGGYRNVLFWGLIPAALLFLFFPQYFGFASNLISETVTMLFSDNSSNVDYRVSGEGDLNYVKHIISEHPFFGIGFYPAPWEKVLDMKNSGITLGLALDASNEVPIYGAVMRLGAVGLLVPALIHGGILMSAFNYLFKLKRYYSLLKSNSIEILIGLTLLYYFFSLFTSDLFSLFLEYYHFPAFALFTALIGMFLGLRARLQARVEHHNNTPYSSTSFNEIQYQNTTP